jgi:hypothetical protein
MGCRKVRRMECKCGCGEQVKGNRKFVNKEHQMEWMVSGGAREIGALMPIEARQAGGRTAGSAQAASGALAEAGRRGAERAREIAADWRRRRNGDEQTSQPA